MTLLRSLLLGVVLSIAAVAALQPVYFAAMANLDHVISPDAMRQHYRDAFRTGVLSDELHPRITCSPAVTASPIALR